VKGLNRTKIPYFKQWGEWIGEEYLGDRDPHHYHQFSDGQHVCRVGTRAAGRLLDGQIHNALPWGDKLRKQEGI